MPHQLNMPDCKCDVIVLFSPFCCRSIILTAHSPVAIINSNNNFGTRGNGQRRETTETTFAGCGEFYLTINSIFISYYRISSFCSYVNQIRTANSLKMKIPPEASLPHQSILPRQGPANHENLPRRLGRCPIHPLLPHIRH